MINRSCVTLFLTFLSVISPALFADTPVHNNYVPMASKLVSVIPAWTKPGKIILVVGNPDSFQYNRFEQKVVDAQAAAQASDLTTPEGLAAANHCKAVWAGSVMVIAPATAEELSADPNLYNVPLTTLMAEHASQYLIGSLTKRQFIQLGTTGLGMTDLSPDQQTMFKAMLPSPLQVVPSSFTEASLTRKDFAEQKGPNAFADKLKKINDDLAAAATTIPDSDVLKQVRLHAYLNIEYELDAPTGGSFGFTLEDALFSNSPKKLTMSEMSSMERKPLQDNPLQRLLIQRAPTLFKPGDLDWNNPKLLSKVPVDSQDSVPTLLTKLSAATGLELYADRSFANESLLIAGDTHSPQPAGSLMQALALAVNGAWRKVGSAYLLTYNTAGYGTQQQFLCDVIQCWSNRVTDADGKVGMQLGTYEWTKVLSTFSGDTADLTKDQVEEITNGGSYGDTKWSALSASAQRQLLVQMHQLADSDLDSATTNSIISSITPDKKVSIFLSIQLALELKNTGIMNFGTFRFSTGVMPKFSYPVSNDKIALSPPIRGILCAPKTGEEAKQVVDMMPGLGLNTLYLDVFANGRAYFPNSVIHPESGAAAAVLPAALAEAASKKIAVYAVIDTFCFQKDGNTQQQMPWPTQFTEDLNIYGEPAFLGVQHRLAHKAIRSDIDAGDFNVPSVNDGWASPLDPDVQKILPALVKSLASTPGIKGLILQDTAPPGYRGMKDTDGVDIDLGYSLKNRLACIKANGSDPIDFDTNQFPQMWDPFSSWQEQFNIYIPARGMNGASWEKSRADADLSILKQCWGAAQQANPALPLLMQERLAGLTFDHWNDPSKVDQIATLDVSKNPFGYVNKDTILDVQCGSLALKTPGAVSWLVTQTKREANGDNAGAIALDLETGAVDENVPTLLRNIAKYMPGQ